jgi:hypothetical protein
MYAKCGSTEDSQRVFTKMHEKLKAWRWVRSLVHPNRLDWHLTRCKGLHMSILPFFRPCYIGSTRQINCQCGRFGSTENCFSLGTYDPLCKGASTGCALTSTYRAGHDHSIVHNWRYNPQNAKYWGLVNLMCSCWNSEKISWVQFNSNALSAYWEVIDSAEYFTFSPSVNSALWEGRTRNWSPLNQGMHT